MRLMHSLVAALAAFKSEWTLRGLEGAPELRRVTVYLSAYDEARLVSVKQAHRRGFAERGIPDHEPDDAAAIVSCVHGMCEIFADHETSARLTLH